MTALATALAMAGTLLWPAGPALALASPSAVPGVPATAVPGVPASAAPVASTSAGMVPVVVCPTEDANLSPKPHIPATVPVPVPRGRAGKVAIFTDAHFGLRVLGPRDWKCSAVDATDGGSRVAVLPPEEGQAPSNLWGTWPASVKEAIVAFGEPACWSCRLTLACPFFAAAARAAKAAFGAKCTRPAREVVVPLSKTVVAFSDPPWVKGDGAPSGGKYPANGVVVFFPAGGTWLSTCTVPAVEHQLCTVSLNNFIATYRQLGFSFTPRPRRRLREDDGRGPLIRSAQVAFGLVAPGRRARVRGGHHGVRVGGGQRPGQRGLCFQTYRSGWFG